MTTKEKVMHAVQDLPDDATIEDAMERLLFLAKIERGIRQVKGSTGFDLRIKNNVAAV